MSTNASGIPTFSSHPYGRSASAAAVHASGQIAPPSAAAEAERQVITQNMWLRRIVVSLTFLGVGVTAGAVLGSMLPRRRDPRSRDAQDPLAWSGYGPYFPGP